MFVNLLLSIKAITKNCKLTQMKIRAVGELHKTQSNHTTLLKSYLFEVS